MEPERLGDGLKALYYGTQVDHWIDSEIAHLQLELADGMPNSQLEVGTTLYDGGLRVRDLTSVTSSHLQEIINKFLSPSKHHRRGTLPAAPTDDAKERR